MIFKKTAINFAMIQAVLLASSIAVVSEIPFDNKVTASIAFFVVSSILTIAPSISLSFLFAYLTTEDKDV